MPITDKLMNAFLAMDSYNRGYGESIKGWAVVDKPPSSIVIPATAGIHLTSERTSYHAAATCMHHDRLYSRGGMDPR